MDFGRSSASFTFGVSKTFILDRAKQSQDLEGESLGQLLDNWGTTWQRTWGTHWGTIWTTWWTTWERTWGTAWGTTWTTPWRDLESLGQLLLRFTLCQVVQQEIGHLNKYRCVLKEIVFLNKKSEELKN